MYQIKFFNIAVNKYEWHEKTFKDKSIAEQFAREFLIGRSSSVCVCKVTKKQKGFEEGKPHE